MTHSIDLTSLLAEREEAPPCGPNLEYSPEYIEVMRLAQGTPEVEYGSHRREASEPDWKAVKLAALPLLERTCDLQLAVLLTRALSALNGFAGLRDGLALIEGFLAGYWAHLHPRLEADDDDDPTERISVLAALNERQGLLRVLCDAPLIDSPVRRIALRDVLVAEGEWPAPAEGGALETHEIDSAANAAAYEDLAATAALLDEAADRLSAIASTLNEQTAYAASGTLDALQGAVKRAGEAVHLRLGQHPGAPRAQAAVAQGEAAVDAAETPQGAVPGGLGCIATRDDVLRALERIRDYYDANEPASPVPLLLERAQRMVDMRFLDIVSELSPSALPEIQHIAGLKT